MGLFSCLCVGLWCVAWLVLVLMVFCLKVVFSIVNPHKKSIRCCHAGTYSWAFVRSGSVLTCAILFPSLGYCVLLPHSVQTEPGLLVLRGLVPKSA